MYPFAYSPFYPKRGVARLYSGFGLITREKAIGYTGAIALVIGLITLTGWLFNFSVFTSFSSVHPNMKFNTALCAIFTGFAVMLFYSGNKTLQLVQKSAAFAALFISSITLLEYILKMQLGIDDLFIADQHGKEAGIRYPGRMNNTTAFCFVIVSAATLVLKSNSIFWQRAAQYTLHLVTLIAFMAIGSYLYSFPIYQKMPVLARMSFGAAVVLFSMSLALSFVHSHRGITSFFTGNGIGEKMARRLFPTMVIVIFVLSAIRFYMHIFHVVSVEAGGALFALSFMVACLFLIGNTAVWLNRLDAEKTKAKDELYELNTKLEGLVVERTESLNKALIGLKESETRFRDAFEYSAIGMALVSLQGQWTKVNKQLCQILGYTEQELLNISLMDISHVGDSDLSRMRSLLEDGQETYTVEKKYLHKTGKAVWVLLNVSLVKDIAGKPQYFVTQVEDISERKIVEEQKHKLVELEAKNKEMEQFAFVASHDLQEPLRTITGFAALLKKRYTGRLDKDADMYLTYMEQSSTRVMDLIKGLLYYSKIGKERSLETVDCNELAVAAINDLRAKIENAKATIECGELPVIKGYALETYVLLQNLISNAVKFRKEGVPPVVKISAENVEGKWLFKVQDNGIGIEEKDRENIFIIFKRLHNRGEYDGEGIGLAHAKKIVDLHNGNIWVESEYGKGSTFYFTLSA